LVSPVSSETPQACLDGDGEEPMVSSARPRGSVGAVDEGLELGAIQVGDLLAFRALGRDGQHVGDHAGMFGMAQRCVVKEGADCSQAGVAGARRVSSLGLEVF
jgi:hypothetical protein